MDTHKNARLTPKGREEVVEGGLSHATAARKFNTTPKTVGKWVKRVRTEGADGLRDRSSRPLSSPDQTPQSVMQTLFNEGAVIVPGRIAVVASRQLIQQTRSE